MKLKIDDVVLLIIDVQEKLFPVVKNSNSVKNNIIKLIKGIQELNIPIIITEQYPKGLGLTIPEIRNELQHYSPIEKKHFSCCGSEEFNKKLASLNRKQILVVGIESHICVYQTCRDLVKNYGVHIFTDCISSRNEDNTKLSLAKLQQEYNIRITSVEMALFELLKIASGKSFKTISKIIK